MCGRYYLDEEIKNERLIEQIRQAMRVSVKLCANLCKVPTNRHNILCQQMDMGAWKACVGTKHRRR